MYSATKITLAEQIKDIGILKAVGSTRKTIILYYILQSLVIIFLSVFVGMLVGFFGSVIVLRVAAQGIHLNITTIYINILVEVEMILTLLLIPLSLIVIPIVRASRYKITDNIKQGKRSLGHKFLPILLEFKVIRKFRSVRYALMFMMAKLSKYIVQVVLFVILGLSFISMLSLTASFTQTLSYSFENELKFDVGMYFWPPIKRTWNNTNVENYIVSLLGKNNIERIGIGLGFQSLLYLNGALANFWLLGFNRINESFQPRLLQGRWWQKDNAKEIVITERMAARYSLTLGESISLFNPAQNITVSVKVVGIVLSLWNLGKVGYMPYFTLSHLFNATNEVNLIGLRLRKNNTLTKDDIKFLLGFQFHWGDTDRTGRLLFREDWVNLFRPVIDIVTLFLLSFLAVFLFVYIMVAIVLAVVTYNEWRKDIAILKSLGLTTTEITTIQLLEQLAPNTIPLVLVTLIIGPIITSFWISYINQEIFPLFYSYNVLFAFLVMLSFSFLFLFILFSVTWRFVRSVKVYSALRWE